MAAAAPLALPGEIPVELPVPPHQLEQLFWERLLPVGMVLLAAALALAAGRLVPIHDEEDGDGPGRPRTWRRLLRALIQGLVFLGVLSGAVAVDRALHGDPRGLDMTERCGSLVAGLWGGFLAIDALGRSLAGRFHRLGRQGAAAVLPLLNKIGKTAWLLLLLVLFLDNLGLDMKALLAGLGVGGLAIALAGQKTIENLFGGVVLVMDQPVRVGDYCRFGANEGTVEDVGLRSVKIRTLDRTLITVPNGDFSQLQLENYARRDRIRFSTQLGLRGDSSPAQLRAILAALQARLEAHPHLDPALIRRVRFVAVGAYSLDLEVCAYFSTGDMERFLLWRQELLLDLLADVEKAGAQLAYPTQTNLIETVAQPGD